MCWFSTPRRSTLCSTEDPNSFPPVSRARILISELQEDFHTVSTHFKWFSGVLDAVHLWAHRWIQLPSDCQPGSSRGNVKVSTAVASKWIMTTSIVRLVWIKTIWHKHIPWFSVHVGQGPLIRRTLPSAQTGQWGVRIVSLKSVKLSFKSRFESHGNVRDRWFLPRKQRSRKLTGILWKSNKAP